MALTHAIEQARRQTATRANRHRQHLAELRLEEIVKVSGIADTYEQIDRQGDLRIETAFARIYQMADSKQLREAVLDAFVAWQDDEKQEEAIVRGQTDGAVAMMKRHNPAFIEGVWVPDGSDGVA